MLWEEYWQSEPDGYGYSHFCDLFREFERRLSPVMRRHHVAGDKVFVDYSGSGRPRSGAGFQLAASGAYARKRRNSSMTGLDGQK